MSTYDLQQRLYAAAPSMLRAGRSVLLLALLLWSAGERTASAQPQPPAPPKSAPAASATSTASAADRKAIHDALAAKYEVLPAHNGVVLKPRKEEGGVRLIEVIGNSIDVNGDRVPDGVLRQWVGAQAEWILRLHRLPPAERQALFGLKAAAPPASRGEQEIPDTAAAPEASTDQAEAPAPGADTSKPAEPEAGAASSEAPSAEEETPEPPEPPEPPSGSGSRVHIFSGITVGKNESVEEAVAVLGSVRVEGSVAENAVAVGGSVEIDGKVGGDVVAVGGSVHLGPHAEVMGNVTSVGGNVYREEGSKVHGSTQDVGVSGGRHWDRDIDFDSGFHLWPLFRAMDLFWRLISLVVLALAVFLCLMAGRRQVQRAEFHVAGEPWKAGLVGFLAQLLFAPLLIVVTVLLAITIVGCALFLLYPFLFVGLVIAALLGYTAVVHQIGLFLERRFNRRFGSPYAVALMGILVIQVWSILGQMIGLGGGFLRFIGLCLLAFGFAMRYAAWTVGLGAMILARINRTQAGGEDLVPAPPFAAPEPVRPAASEPPAPAEPGTGPVSLPLSERHWDEEGEKPGEEPPPEK